MSVTQWAVLLSLIAATIPLFLSAFAVFSPQTRVRDTKDYFLNSASVDIDSFLKASIGYSLQVAAIFLFFYWAIKYGVNSLLVAGAWTAGYFLMAWAVKRQVLDEFVIAAADRAVVTIHGFIAYQLHTTSKAWKKAAVLTVATASVIGLGGSLITEIDYTTKILFQTIGASSSLEGAPQYESGVHLTILFFVTFYVLWGGYKAVVFTERFQVPAAYVSFFVFGIGVLYIAGRYASSGKALIAVAVFLLLVILAARLFLLKNVKEPTAEAAGAAWLTFLPLIGLALVFLAFGEGDWTLPKNEVLFPEVKYSLGFGLVGAVSLFLTNAIWQFIDISSLQRLQSVGKHWHHQQGRAEVARALRVIGIEAGLGWTLIITVGLGLRAVGIDDVAKIGPTLIKYDLFGHALLPVFTFALSVFMISTISGFVSAISYISYYDVVRLDHRTGMEIDGAPLRSARATTALAIAFLYIGYLILRSWTGNNISAALYAIYAFQIAILPSVLTSMNFGNTQAFKFLRTRLRPFPVIVSTIAGLVTAAAAATQTDFLGRYIPEDSVTVFPPLAVIVVTAVVFMVLASVPGNQRK